MRLYTAREAAEVLRLSKQTVWKYGREGKLKTVRFGRTVRYDLEGGHYEGIHSEGNGNDGIHRAGYDDAGRGGNELREECYGDDGKTDERGVLRKEKNVHRGHAQGVA